MKTVRMRISSCHEKVIVVYFVVFGFSVNLSLIFVKVVLSMNSNNFRHHSFGVRLSVVVDTVLV